MVPLFHNIVLIPHLSMQSKSGPSYDYEGFNVDGKCYELLQYFDIDSASANISYQTICQSWAVDTVRYVLQYR
jgi:hypothetical protein